MFGVLCTFGSVVSGLIIVLYGFIVCRASQSYLLSYPCCGRRPFQSPPYIVLPVPHLTGDHLDGADTAAPSPPGSLTVPATTGCPRAVITRLSNNKIIATTRDNADTGRYGQTEFKQLGSGNLGTGCMAAAQSSLGVTCRAL